MPRKYPVKVPSIATDTDATLTRLPLSGLGRCSAGVRSAVRAFRVRIEAELLAAGGGGVAAACKVHTAAVAFKRHLEAEKRLADANGTLPLEAWLALSDRSVRWLEARDRAIAALGLDARVKPSDPWDSIYNAQPVASPAAAAPETCQDRPQDVSEPSGDQQAGQELTGSNSEVE
jgi:hypothetical protein